MGKSTDCKAHKISHPVGLRTGNLVFNQHGEVHSLRRNDLSRFDHPQMGGDYGLYAIPLTQEVLSACGYIPDPDFGKFEGVTARGIFTVNFKNNGLQLDHQFEINFLHQLQNYYFCIYGIELEYKP